MCYLRQDQAYVQREIAERWWPLRPETTVREREIALCFVIINMLAIFDFCYTHGHANFKQNELEKQEESVLV